MPPSETIGPPGPALALPPAAFPARLAGWGASALLHGAVAAFLLAAPLPSPSHPGTAEIALAAAAGMESGGAAAETADAAADAIEEEVLRDVPPDDVLSPLAEVAEPVPADTAERAGPETVAVAQALPPPSPPPPPAPPRPRPVATRSARGPVQPATATLPSGTVGESGPKAGPFFGAGAAGSASPEPAATGAAGTGSAAPASGDGAREGLPASYQALLQRILRRAHRVPEAAREARVSGTALVQAVIARDGRVVHHHIHRSSGSPILDGEALALFHRVSPFPPIPDSYGPSQVRIDVPVEFRVVW